MANATIFPNTISILSWSSSSSVTALTENSTTNVTNSSGYAVYWTEGTNSGSIANSGTLQCTKGTVDKKWDFADTSTGAAKITLTVTGSGGGG
jgi:type II secretory pathway pseudopilin PulG